MKTHQKPTKSKAIIKLDFSKDQGFVKLQRSILESPIFADPKIFRVYIWCLLKANHTTKVFSIKTGKGSTLVECKRGTFITGRNKASDDLGISGSTFRSHLTRIQKFGLLKVMPTAHYTIVEVVNYDTQKTTNHSANQTTYRQPLVTTKKDKKENNEKNQKKYISKYFQYYKNVDKSDYTDQFISDYKSVAQLISKKLKNINRIKNLFKIEDFFEVREKYATRDIISTLELINSHASVKNYLDIKAPLISWLKRNNQVVPSTSKVRTKQEQAMWNSFRDSLNRTSLEEANDRGEFDPDSGPDR